MSLDRTAATRADERDTASVVPVLSRTEIERRWVVSGVPGIDGGRVPGQRWRCLPW
jgi:hypothetical protein